MTSSINLSALGLDDQRSERTRKEYYQDAAQHINKAGTFSQGGERLAALAFLSRGLPLSYIMLYSTQPS